VIARDGAGTTSAFDPEATLAYYREEGYLPPPRRPWTMGLPFHHHLIPGPCRRLAGQALSLLDSRRGPPAQAFYPAWPKEPVVAALLLALEGGPLTPSGPEAAPPRAGATPPPAEFAFALSHDVDTAHGQRLAGRVAEIEAAAGLVSTWFFVPRHYRLDRGLLAELRAGGHEIGCHGYDHSGSLPFEPEEKARAKLESLRPFLEENGVTGFRSPGLLRTAGLFALLGRYFRYDSSVPDTEMYTGAGWRNGCCSVRPFARGRLLEIPITLPLDAALIHYRYGPRRILRTWLDKADWLAAVGGLAVVDTHPEPQYSGSRSMLRVYRELLDRLKERGRPAGTLAEVAGVYGEEGSA